MKILMIEGSPHKNGTSNTIAAEFIKGAESAGQTVETVDAVRTKIGGCLGCIVCQPEPCACRRTARIRGHEAKAKSVPVRCSAVARKHLTTGTGLPSPNDDIS